MATEEAGYASAVVVSVTPKEPSCFAGEVLECKITFTNTNAPIRPPSADHRRSMSSVRTGSVLYGDQARLAHSRGEAPFKRHGLVAVNTPEPDTAAPSSLASSTFVTSRFSGSQGGLARPGARAGPRRHGWPMSHPHARQKSVVAYQVEDLSQAFGLLQNHDHADADAAAESTTVSGAAPHALTDFQPSPHPDMYVSHNEAMDAALRDSVVTWAGDSLTEHEVKSPLFPERDTLPIGHEKLLWTFAQFGGTMELEHGLVRATDFDRLRMRLARGELPSVPSSPASAEGTPRTLGGGEFGYDAEYEAGSIEYDTGLVTADLREKHAPAIATIAALLFRPASMLRSPQQHQQPSPSLRHSRSGSTLSDIQTRTLMSRTLPTYSTPPTMLGIDMQLAPGESRSFTFKLQLPMDLPPSFHGHSVHFDYYLTVGTNRADTRSGSAQQSRLLHIPIRIYNHVAPSTGLHTCFDLLNPIVTPQLDASVAAVQETSAAGGASAAAGKSAQAYEEERAETAQWIARLWQGAQPVNERTDAPTVPSCMDCVHDLTQRAGKVSYDIAKNGHVAAVLTLARAKYRLGDDVQAIVRMNMPETSVRIVRVRIGIHGCTCKRHTLIRDSLQRPSSRTKRSTLRWHSCRQGVCRKRRRRCMRCITKTRSIHDRQACC